MQLLHTSPKFFSTRIHYQNIELYKKRSYKFELRHYHICCVGNSQMCQCRLQRLREFTCTDTGKQLYPSKQGKGSSYLLCFMNYPALSFLLQISRPAIMCVCVCAWVCDIAVMSREHAQFIQVCFLMQ